MSAISSDHLSVLKEILQERYVPHLPELLPRQGASEQENSAKQISRAFSAFVIQKQCESPLEDAASAVVDNYNDNGIDAIYFSESEKTLYIIQSKLHASHQFSEGDAIKFCNGLNLLLKQQYDRFNKNVLDREDEIRRYLDECTSIKLIIAYTGDGIAKHAEDKLSDFVNDDRLVDNRVSKEIIYLTGRTVSHYLLEESRNPQVDVELKIEKPQEIKSARKMVHGIISVSDLVNLHKIYGKSLYEKNIRYYLGSKKSEVNSAIKKTLETDPQNFIYLNNGITALCDSLESGSAYSRKSTHKAKAFSIVNGAQTISSASEYCAQHEDADISEAKVTFTLIHAPHSGAFHKEITKARNFQNRVKTESFISLDEKQESIRQNLALHNIKYQYRPEDISQSKKDDIININHLIKSLGSLLTDPRHAIWLKTDIAKYKDVESIEYKSIFKDHGNHKIINSCQAFSAIDSLVKEYSSLANGIEKLVYQHSLFVMSFIMMKRLQNRIYENQLISTNNFKTTISTCLDQLRDQTISLYRSKEIEDIGVQKFFQSQTICIPFLTELMAINYGLAEEASRIPSSSLDEHEYPEAQRINFLCSRRPQI